MAAVASGAAAGVSPFQVRKFSDIALEMIRERILVGQLQPGERINEVALAESLSISRPPLREALRMLHGEGLVEFTPRGATVASFDLESVQQLGDVRIALECQMARLAAERADERDIARLEGLMARIESALCEPDHAYPRDTDFHSVLALATRNARLADAADDVKRRLSLARSKTGSDAERARRALGEHRAICDAIIAHDPGAAEAAMRIHIEGSMRAMVARITAEREDDRR